MRKPCVDCIGAARALGVKVEELKRLAARRAVHFRFGPMGEMLFAASDLDAARRVLLAQRKARDRLVKMASGAAMPTTYGDPAVVARLRAVTEGD